MGRLAGMGETSDGGMDGGDGGDWSNGGWMAGMGETGAMGGRLAVMGSSWQGWGAAGAMERGWSDGEWDCSSCRTSGKVTPEPALCYKINFW